MTEGANYQSDQEDSASEDLISISADPAVVEPGPEQAATNNTTLAHTTSNATDIPDDGTTQNNDSGAQTAESAPESDSPASMVPDSPTPVAADPAPALETLEIQPTPTPVRVTENQASTLPIGGRIGNQAPEFQSINNWINSDPLTMQELRGRVVLIDFWTYTCINCIRTLPYVKQWYADYAGHGLVVVGVHSPEFQFEKDTDNVIEAANGFEIEYPIAQDNEFGTWHAFSNRYWPAKYLIDQHGVVRYRHFGEGAYTETEQQIRKLLEETGISLSN